jgi:hypothetical protein
MRAMHHANVGTVALNLWNCELNKPLFFVKYPASSISLQSQQTD